MRFRVVVFGAIGAIEIALVREVEAALERFAIENALSRIRADCSRKIRGRFYRAGSFKFLDGTGTYASVKWLSSTIRGELYLLLFLFRFLLICSLVVRFRLRRRGRSVEVDGADGMAFDVAGEVEEED